MVDSNTTMALRIMEGRKEMADKKGKKCVTMYGPDMTKIVTIEGLRAKLGMAAAALAIKKANDPYDISGWGTPPGLYMVTAQPSTAAAAAAAVAANAQADVEDEMREYGREAIRAEDLEQKEYEAAQARTSSTSSERCSSRSSSTSSSPPSRVSNSPLASSDRSFSSDDDDEPEAEIEPIADKNVKSDECRACEHPNDALPRGSAKVLAREPTEGQPREQPAEAVAREPAGARPRELGDTGASGGAKLACELTKAPTHKVTEETAREPADEPLHVLLQRVMRAPAAVGALTCMLGTIVVLSVMLVCTLNRTSTPA